jgi:hypothetical protein
MWQRKSIDSQQDCRAHAVARNPATTETMTREIGRRVQIVSPRDEKWDFNDLLRRSGDGERNRGV